MTPAEAAVHTAYINTLVCLLNCLAALTLNTCTPAARLSAGPASTMGTASPAATLRPKLPEPAAAAVRLTDTAAVPYGLTDQGTAGSNRRQGWNAGW